MNDEASFTIVRSGVCDAGAAEVYRVFSMIGTVTLAIPGLSIVGGGRTSLRGSYREEDETPLVATI